MHRGSLIDALAAALPPGVVHLGVAVTGVDDTGNTEDRADTVVVRTSAGDLRADAVVRRRHAQRAPWTALPPAPRPASRR
ncbi:hypothetical protein LUR56_37300 [Streptomyces sp. MT29]|nr:hypothetical protein [Streptomyces sp. MT29]